VRAIARIQKIRAHIHLEIMALLSVSLLLFCPKLGLFPQIAKGLKKGEILYQCVRKGRDDLINEEKPRICPPGVNILVKKE